MFCHSCGREVAEGLSYCNQCGARLAGAADTRSGSGMLLSAVIGLPFLGVALLFGVIAALKNGMGFRDDFIFVVTFLSFLLFAIAEIACVIMLLARSRGTKAPKARDAGFTNGRLAGGEPRGLGSPTFEPTPVGSVTDHTTRTLDPARRRES